jgi:peroxiredoxin Q/BCP
MRKYGAYGPKKMYGRLVEGVIRSTVLIDPKGKVAHHWPGLRAKGHAERVLETLTRLCEGA